MILLKVVLLIIYIFKRKSFSERSDLYLNSKFDFEFQKCPIFVGLFLISSVRYERNNYMGLISDQNCTFGWMVTLLKKS